jgi:hypothetical protein
MAQPGERMTRGLSGIKGWPKLDGIDFAAVVADPDLVIPSGSVVHVNNDGELEPGIGNKFAMPLFTITDSDSYQISDRLGGNPLTDKKAYVTSASSAGVVCIPAIAAVELSSTEFDTAGTYLPNAALTSPVTGTNKGKLVTGTVGTHTICGLVSRGVIPFYEHEALAFWPVFLPPM